MKGKTPSIGEKVRFWEEQDKINNALIPRFLADHKQISIVSQEMVKLSTELSNAKFRHDKLEKKVNEINTKLTSAVAQELVRVTTDMQATKSKYQELAKRVDEMSSLICELNNKTVNQAESSKRHLLPYVVSGAAVLLSIIAIIIS